MKERIIKKQQNKFINQVFWQSLNPIAITDGPKGTFGEVNEAFLKRLGFNRKEIIGNTVVKTGLVTYKESLAFIKEVKENGYAKNILMKLKTQSDQIHFIINILNCLTIIIIHFWRYNYV